MFYVPSDADGIKSTKRLLMQHVCFCTKTLYKQDAASGIKYKSKKQTTERKEYALYSRP